MPRTPHQELIVWAYNFNLTLLPLPGSYNETQTLALLQILLSDK